MVAMPEINHWIVSVARQAGLDNADRLSIPAATPPAEAWAAVQRAADLEPDRLADVVANHFRLRRADFSNAELAATRLVPGSLARRRGVLVFHCTDRVVTVATADPVSLEAEKELADLTARTVEFEIAPPREIAAAVEEAYGPPTAPPRHAIPPLDASGPGRILVVDDDADTRLLLRTTLEQRGYGVVEAASGEEALGALTGVRLVTLDLRMAGMSGLDVLRQIRSRLDTGMTPVIVATAVGDPETEMKLFEAGADDFVVKPVDPPRFLLRVEAVLRRHGVAGTGGA